MTFRLRRAIPVLPVPDLQAAVRFWVDRLGFTEVVEVDDYAGVERDGVQVHFWRSDDPELPKVCSCRIDVEGIDALHEACRAAGILHPDGALVEQPWGFGEFAALDPWGNLITFGEELPA